MAQKKKETTVLATEEVTVDNAAIHQPVAPVSTTTRTGSKAVALIVGGVVVALLIGGIGGFAIGRETSGANNSANKGAPQFGAEQGQFGRPGGMMNRMGSIGIVTSISDTSITVEDDRSGDTVTYSITSDTTITNGMSPSPYTEHTV